MVIYILLFLFILVALLAPIQVQKEITKIIFLIFIVLAGMRAVSVGADSLTYADLLKTSVSNPVCLVLYQYEFIFYYGVIFLGKLTVNSQVLFFIMNLLVLLPLYYFLEHESPNMVLSAFIFLIAMNSYYLETYNLMRQSIATSFILWFFYYVKNDEKLKAVFFLLVAIGFHTSSIFVLPLMFIRKIKLQYSFVVYSIIFSSFIGLAYFLYGSNVIAYFSKVLSSEVSKYAYNAHYVSNIEKNFNGLLMMIIPNSFLCLCAYPKLKDEYYYKVFFIGTIITNLIASHFLAYRITYALIILEIIILPLIIINSGKGKLKTTCIVYIFFLCLFYFYHLIKIAGNNALIGHSVIPYMFYFEKI